MLLAKLRSEFIETLIDTDVAEIVLYHLTGTRRMNQILAWSDWSNVSDIIAAIWKHAVAFANGLPSVQTFTLRGFAKSDIDRSDPIASTSFRGPSEEAA